jgi:hypothetical protein
MLGLLESLKFGLRYLPWGDVEAYTCLYQYVSLDQCALASLLFLLDLMEYGTAEDRNRVFAFCVGKVMHMSHDKFASNIIENVLKKGSHMEKVNTDYLFEI